MLQLAFCGYVMLETGETVEVVLLVKDQSVPDNQIYCHPDKLGLLNSQIVSAKRASQVDKFWFVRTHDPNSRLNLFPIGAQTCRYIEVATV
jgi:hypothetical protein